MVRITAAGVVNGDRQYLEFAGLSTDTKPVGGAMTGSVFLEVDTGNAYLYDEEADEWNKVGD